MRALVLSIVLVLTGCATRDACPAGQLALPSTTPTFVVVRSPLDYSSSAIALLAADGTILEPDFVDSGTRVSSLVTSLGGDAVVPSTPLGQGVVAWIDREPIDELTIVRGGVATQIDTRGESVGGVRTGFSANPQDAVMLDDQRMLVARYGLNLDASAPEVQRGDDVVLIEGGVLTQRIALPHGEATGCGTSDCTAYARPSVLLPMRAGSAFVVLVVLERLDISLHYAGPGAVVALNVTASTVTVSTPVGLDPLENCQFGSLDPSNPARAYLSCSGPQSLMVAEDRRSTAGIAELTLDASGSLTVTAIAQTQTPDAVVSGAIIALGDRRVLAIATDASPSLSTLPDHVLAIDVGTSSIIDVFQTSSGYQLGPGVLAGTVALIPDAETSAILRFDVGDTVVLRDSIRFDDCVDLPPRQIGRLSF